MEFFKKTIETIKEGERQSKIIVLLCLMIFVISGLSVNNEIRARRVISELEKQNLSLGEIKSDLSSTTTKLGLAISNSHLSLSEELTKEKEKASVLENKLGTFEEKVGTISGTVTTLEKLSKTDPELLQKYSKVFFLNEHYAPERLVQIEEQYEYSKTKTNKIHAGVWPNLLRLLVQSKIDGVDIFILSAFRSFEEQKSLKGQYSVTYGAGTANQFSADQGYSEHQLGTAVDFMTTGIGGSLTTAFDKTKAYEWLTNNAYRYGFTLSYPKGNSYYVYEPWHWRFVGVSLATYLHNNQKNFYDMDQRDIDTYLVSMFD